MTCQAPEARTSKRRRAEEEEEDEEDEEEEEAVKPAVAERRIAFSREPCRR